MAANKRVYQEYKIVDLEGLNGMAIFWNQKSIDFLKRIANVGGDNYPESAAKIVLVNCPSLISRAWGAVT